MAIETPCRSMSTDGYSCPLPKFGQQRRSCAFAVSTFRIQKGINPNDKKPLKKLIFIALERKFHQNSGNS